MVRTVLLGANDSHRHILSESRAGHVVRVFYLVHPTKEVFQVSELVALRPAVGFSKGY
jgi:serine phosphatase RsbU (regulator of sigma subunit)